MMLRNIAQTRMGPPPGMTRGMVNNIQQSPSPTQQSPSPSPTQQSPSLRPHPKLARQPLTPPRWISYAMPCGT